MAVLGWAAATALAAVLLVSGLAKLLDRVGTREAVAGFGVPSSLVRVLAASLAPAELVSAALLVVPATRPLGVLLAGALLVTFTTAVAVAMRAGRRPACHCFGRLGGADVSGRTIARNLALVALVAVAAGAGHASTDGARLGTALGVVTAAAVLAAELVAGRQARARRAAEDIAAFAAEPDRAPVPPFVLSTPDGRAVDSRELMGAGRPTLFVALAPGCGPCEALRPDVAGWAAALGDRLTVVVMGTGTAEANRVAYESWRDRLLVLVDPDGEVRSSLGTISTPSAVVVGPSGRPATSVATGEQLVRRLVAEYLAGTRLDWQRPGENGIAPDELDLGSAPALRAGVVARPAGESTLLVDPRLGASVLVDARGAAVAASLGADRSLETVARELAASFGAPVDVVAADVLAAARALGQAGLLAGVVPATGAASTTGHAPSQAP